MGKINTEMYDKGRSVVKFVRMLLSSAGFVVSLYSATLAHATSMEQVTQNIKDICYAPTTTGKYWDVNIKGSGDANVKLKLANGGMSAEVAFRKGEWDGVQQVLKEHQATDNADYRRCVEKLTPLFLEKFAAKSYSPTDKKSNNNESVSSPRLQASQSQRSGAVLAPFSSTEDGALIVVKGNDVLVHDRIIQAIPGGYTPGEPVYVAYGEKAGCGPIGNSWMYPEDIDVKHYEIYKEGVYWRVKDMVGIQFQVVQLMNGKSGNGHVKYAVLESLEENKYFFRGKTYKKGTKCEARSRSAIFVEK